MADEKTKILLIDDDIDTRDVYVNFLQESGYEVDEAENGLEGLEKIQGSKPDLIITGIIMPKMDGFTLVQALKQNVDTANVPIIFLSHLGRQEDQHRSKELGVDDFIVRDTTPLREVLSRIKALLSNTEYLLAIEPGSYDAKRFTQDLGLSENFASAEMSGGRYVLRIKLVDHAKRRFGGEVISA